MNRYDETLAQIACGKGCRNSRLVPRLTMQAVRAGYDIERVVGDVHSVAPDYSAADIRRKMRSAAQKIGASITNALQTRAERPQGHPLHVRHLVEAGGWKATGSDLRALSRIPISGLSPLTQRTLFLEHLWAPDDQLFIDSSARHRTGLPGTNIRSRREWVKTESITGDLISMNPLTGRAGTTEDGKASYTSKGCIAVYRYVCIEFDQLPLSMQCAFWTGFIRKSTLAPRLTALVFSGSKSIHGLLRIDASSKAEQQAWQGRLEDLFSSSMEEWETSTGERIRPFRADPAGFRPRQSTRLAGVLRETNGTQQELLYLNR